MTDRALCAKDVRAFLKSEYPGIKFRVTSKKATWADAVEVVVPKEHAGLANEVAAEMYRFRKRRLSDVGPVAEDVPNKVDFVQVQTAR
jgi:prephenate dehydratase